MNIAISALAALLIRNGAFSSVSQASNSAGPGIVALLTLPQCVSPSRGIIQFAGISLFLSRDVSRAIAVLVVGCPRPFILASPAAMVAGLAAATRKGILIKNAKFVKALTEVDAVIFDKTGTVTFDQLKVISLVMHDSNESPRSEAASDVWSRRAVADRLHRALRF